MLCLNFNQIHKPHNHWSSQKNKMMQHCWIEVLRTHAYCLENLSNSQKRDNQSFLPMIFIKNSWHISSGKIKFILKLKIFKSFVVLLKNFLKFIGV